MKFIAATALVAVATYVAVYSRAGGDAPIHSDGYSYYVYLPATIIYKDPSLAALADEWYGGVYPDFTGITRRPDTGRWLNPHPIGVAVLMAPFFLLSDALTWWSNLPRDGFSFYYQHGAGLAGIAYFLAGLALLQRILSRHFSGGVVLATLVCITWGTNLFHYAVFDGTFSHAFSFFLVCAWLFFTERWWQRPSRRDSVMLGIIAALIVLIRHTNAILLLVLPLYGIGHARELRERPAELWRRRQLLLIAIVVGTIGLIPQFVLYRWTTGSWIANSYAAVDVRFNWGSPRIVSVLFSTQKGLFFWSPLLLLTLVGAIVAEGWTRGLVLAASVVFALTTYLVASWSEWQFGASYGHRAFTDGFPIAAPFLASTFAWASRRAIARRVIATLAVATVLLSIVQMLQYWNGIMPNADTTWAQYRSRFLRWR